MFDFERGAKTTGAKWYFNTGRTAIAEWRLLNDAIAYYMMQGYEFIIPPFAVNRKTATQAGILPRFEGDFYNIAQEEKPPTFWERVENVFKPVTRQAKDTDLLMIPTAETPMVGFHADEIIEEKRLPLRYCAITPCFRREAGAAGKRDKGMKRVHQFFKVELFTVCTPENADAEHKRTLATIQGFYNYIQTPDERNGQVAIPGAEFRLIELPEWDRAPVAVKAWDIELKIDDEWVEIGTISNTGENQTKPAMVRYRPTERAKGGILKKPVRCAMINGTGLATPRILLAIFGEASDMPRVREEIVNDEIPDPKTAPFTLHAEPEEPVPFDLDRRWRFDEYMGDDQPAKVVTKTGHEILEEYWEFWQQQMVQAGHGEDPTKMTIENCINDYCVVNWAWEVDKNGEKVEG